jgi:Na+/H+ antiporter NhaA
VPNGMFFYFILFEFSSLAQVLSNFLALGFIIDAFMATGLLAWWFAEHPLGSYSWKTFIALSLLGGLGFSLPFFYYLNTRSSVRE